MSKFFTIFALIITFSVAVCAQKAVAKTDTNTASVAAASPRAAIDALRAKFAQGYNLQNADAIAAFYTDDATYIGTDGDIVQGKENIRLGLKDELPYFRNFTLSAVEFGSDNNLAYERGTFSARLEAPDKEPQTINGKYMIVYRLGRDKQWKIQMQMSSRDQTEK